MRSLSTRKRWQALLLVVAALCVTPAMAGRPHQAPDRGVFGANDGPAYMLISLTPDFIVPDVNRVNKNNCDDMGSQLILVQVGTYFAGFDVGDTFYAGDSNVEIPVGSLPIDPNTGLPYDPESLNQNQYALLGSFCTFGGEIHYTSTDPDPVLPSVQEAFFYASATLDSIGTQFPTTTQLAYHIFDNQGPDANATFDDIHETLYRTSSRLNCTQCAGSDDIFPHQPVKRLFTAEFNFSTDDGALDLEHVSNVGFDFKATNTTDPINLGSNGNFHATLLTQDREDDPTAEVNFDAVADVVLNDVELFGELELSNGSTVTVGPLFPTKHTITDVDGDGDLDLKLFWDTDELQAFVEAQAPGQPEVLMTLRVVGVSADGMTYTGADDVKVVP